jgi:hypothetical protein
MKNTITAKRCYTPGHVNVTVEASIYSPYGERASIAAKTTLTISTEEARRVAADLVALADAADAKVAKETARRERRAAWYEREIAAGRMQRMSVSDLLRRTLP